MQRKTKIIIIGLIALVLAAAGVGWWFMRGPRLSSEMISILPDDVTIAIDHNGNKLSDFLDKNIAGYKGQPVPVLISTANRIDEQKLLDLGARPLVQNIYTAKLTTDQLQQLSQFDSIIIVEEDQVLRGSQAEDLGGFNQGGGQTAGSTNQNRAPPIRVAVMDSGIDPTSPLIGADKVGGWYDAVNGQSKPYDDEINTGQHGTKVAAVLLDQATVDTEIVAVKVLGKNGQGVLSDVIAGAQWIKDNADRLNIKVVNMSFEFTDYNYAVHQLCHQLSSAGVVLVAATGNTGRNVTYPAAYDEVIAVGAYDASKQEVADFSGKGAQVDVIADGVNVKLQKNGQEYDIGSGTSFAAPAVAAKVLQLIKEGATSQVDILAAIREGTQDVGAPGRDQTSGLGYIAPATVLHGASQGNQPSKTGGTGSQSGAGPSPISNAPTGAGSGLAVGSSTATGDDYAYTVVGNGPGRTADGTFALDYAEKKVSPARSKTETISRNFVRYSGGEIGRYGHTMNLLSDGKVLVAGGMGEDTQSYFTAGRVLQTAVMYDPATRLFDLIESVLNIGRVNHTATTLPNGDVLFLGGACLVNHQDCVITNGSSSDEQQQKNQEDWSKLIDAENARRIANKQEPIPTNDMMGAAKQYLESVSSWDPTVNLAGGEVFSIKEQKFIPLRDYYTTFSDEVREMAYPRAKHSATYIPSTNQVLILGGVKSTNTMSEKDLLAKKKTEAPVIPTGAEMEKNGVKMKIESERDSLGRGETTYITVTLVDNKAKESNTPGRWTTKTRVTLNISGPARFRDVDPKTGKIKKDEGLTGNIKTVSFELYPGSTPYKFRTRLTSYLDQKETGNITLNANATYKQNGYAVKLEIKRDPKKFTPVDTSVYGDPTRRYDGILFEFKSDKEALGRIEPANLSLLFDNVDNKLGAQSSESAKVELKIVSGSGRFWTKDEDLGHNITSLSYTLLPRLTPTRLPNAGVPLLRVLSSAETSKLVGNIQVTALVTYYGKTYDKSILIKLDPAKVVERQVDPKWQQKVLDQIHYRISRNSQYISAGRPATITVQMGDYRPLYVDKVTGALRWSQIIDALEKGGLLNLGYQALKAKLSPARIHISATEPVRIRYTKPNSLTSAISSNLDLVGKEVDAVIYPGLGLRVAKFTVEQASGEASTDATVSVSINYDGQQYPSQPKSFSFKVIATPTDPTRGEGQDKAPDNIEYSLRPETLNLPPGQTTNLEFAFRYSDAYRTKLGDEKPEGYLDTFKVRVYVQGRGTLAWRGMTSSELKQDEATPWFGGRIHAQLISSNVSYTDGETMTVISEVTYRGKVYIRRVDVSREPSDEQEMADAIKSLSDASAPVAIHPDETAPTDTTETSPFVLWDKDEYDQEKSAAQSAEVNILNEAGTPNAVERLANNAGDAVGRAWDNLTGRDNELRGLPAEVFDVKKGEFTTLGDEFSPGVGHAAVLIDRDRVLIADPDSKKLVIYSAKDQRFEEVGKVEVAGDISIALQQDAGGGYGSAFLFGRQTLSTVQVVSLSDFSSVMLNPQMSRRDLVAGYREVLNIQEQLQKAYQNIFPGLLDFLANPESQQQNRGFYYMQKVTQYSGPVIRSLCLANAISPEFDGNCNVARLQDAAYFNESEIFGGVASATHLYGNTYLLTTVTDSPLLAWKSTGGDQLHTTGTTYYRPDVIYDLDTNTIKGVWEEHMPVSNGSDVKTVIAQNRFALAYRHKVVSLEDGTALIFGGANSSASPYSYDQTMASRNSLDLTLALSPPDTLFEQELEDNKTAQTRAYRLFDTLIPPKDTYDTGDKFALQTKHADGFADAKTRSALSLEMPSVRDPFLLSDSRAEAEFYRSGRYKESAWAKYYNGLLMGSFAAYIAEPSSLILDNGAEVSTQPTQPESNQNTPPTTTDQNVTGSSDVSGVITRENPPKHEYPGEYLLGGQPDKTVKSYKYSGHEYSLRITLDQPSISPMIGASVTGRVELLQDGQPVREVPEGLWGYRFTGGLGFSGDTPPSVQLSTVLRPKVGKLSRVIGASVSSDHGAEQKYTTSLYSPQAGQTVTRNGKTTTISGLDLSSGSAEFTYTYGGGREIPYIQFEASTVLNAWYAGMSTNHGIYFEDQLQGSVTTPQLAYVGKGDLYYDVKVTPQPVKATDKVSQQVLKIEVTSRDTKTGQINTNPYQAVDISLVPVRSTFDARSVSAGGGLNVKKPGDFNPRGDEVAIKNGVYHNTAYPMDYSEAWGVHLINGQGIAYMTYNGAKGLAPYFAVVVEPEGYGCERENVVYLFGSMDDFNSIWDRVEQYRQKYGDPYCKANHIQVPPAPGQKQVEGGNFILYEKWTAYQDYLNLRQQVYTIKTVPIN